MKTDVLFTLMTLELFREPRTKDSILPQRMLLSLLALRKLKGFRSCEPGRGRTTVCASQCHSSTRGHSPP